MVKVKTLVLFVDPGQGHLCRLTWILVEEVTSLLSFWSPVALWPTVCSDWIRHSVDMYGSRSELIEVPNVSHEVKIFLNWKDVFSPQFVLPHHCDVHIKRHGEHWTWEASNISKFFSRLVANRVSCIGINFCFGVTGRQYLLHCFFYVDCADVFCILGVMNAFVDR